MSIEDHANQDDKRLAELHREIPVIERLRSLLVSGNEGDYMSYDPTSDEGMVMHISANLKEVPDLQTLTNQDVLISHIAITDASREGKNGQVEEWKRIVLFTDKGEPYSCGSQGIMKSLWTLLPVCGMWPWKPAIKCKVRVERLGNGNSWMTLDPDIASIVAARKSRK